MKSFILMTGSSVPWGSGEQVYIPTLLRPQVDQLLAEYYANKKELKKKPTIDIIQWRTELMSRVLKGGTEIVDCSN